jgi:hypothetical protein
MEGKEGRKGCGWMEGSKEGRTAGKKEGMWMEGRKEGRDMNGRKEGRKEGRKRFFQRLLPPICLPSFPSLLSRPFIHAPSSPSVLSSFSRVSGTILTERVLTMPIFLTGLVLTVLIFLTEIVLTLLIF